MFAASDREERVRHMIRSAERAVSAELGGLLGGERATLMAALDTQHLKVSYDGSLQQGPLPSLGGVFDLDVPSVALNVADPRGKVLRLAPPNGSIPPDNPFVDTPGARPEIWAYGFRQPWKISFDRLTGDLWVGEVGQDIWEIV